MVLEETANIIVTQRSRGKPTPRHPAGEMRDTAKIDPLRMRRVTVVD
jgi:hypothetical protein